MVESFLAALQLELLDRQTRDTCQELAKAIFEYIDAWCYPHRRHSAIGMLSPVEFGQAHTAHAIVA